MHCGYDIAFPEWDIASPERIMNVINKFPGLKFITTHLGAWKEWDMVEKLMIGKIFLWKYLSHLDGCLMIKLKN